MSYRRELLRVIRFDRPQRIPMTVSFTGPCWYHYPVEVLSELMASHPLLFPDFDPEAPVKKPTFAPWRRAGQSWTDSWGCVWETAQDGCTGVVAEHPVSSWDALDSLQSPDPDHQHGWDTVDWRDMHRRFENAKAQGRFARGSLRHGHTFLTLTYLRGYENVILDMADADPRIDRLVGIVEAFNLGIVERLLTAGADWIGYPEDLGMQRGPMISPRLFGRYIKPVYEHLMAPARAAGCIIHMHSDGDIRALVDDLLDCGVDVLNLQDLVNGIDWIQRNLKGRVCIDLDVDRQNITQFGTPADNEALIREEVEKLGSPEGGLMLRHAVRPGEPVENIRAVMDAMERYSDYYT